MNTIRGAITIENNEQGEIIEATRSLLEKIIESNGIDISDIIYILFTATKDIDEAYPAVAARQMGILEASLMCVQEMHVKGSLPMCIRVMVAINGNKPQSAMKHCYMKNAERLRPDLLKAPSYSIAVDGNTASGKSTVAKEIAKRLSLLYIDTGAMYRAVALHCIRNGIDCTMRELVIPELTKFQITVKYENNEQYIYLDGEDVSEAIRTQEAARGASDVATMPEVRERLVEFQRSLAKDNNVIMDGRDIGTVVLPDSKFKFFITASLGERTKRRCIDLEKKGLPNNFEQVKEEIEKRDYTDTSREASPLLRAEDAQEIDTTMLTFEETVQKIMDIIGGRS